MIAKQVCAQYTQEFKLKAVRQVRAGQAQSVVAKVLDVPNARDGLDGFLQSPQVAFVTGLESPRELRRLQHLRRWSHDKVKQVLTQGPRAGDSPGSGMPR